MSEILSTVSILGLLGIALTVYFGLKQPDKDYDAPEGEPVPKPPEDIDKEKQYKTKALGFQCHKDSDCSATGRFGGRESGPLDRIHCDQKTPGYSACSYDRKDYTGIFWFPPSKCKRSLFAHPGGCDVTEEENELVEKIKREGNVEKFGTPIIEADRSSNRTFRD